MYCESRYLEKSGESFWCVPLKPRGQYAKTYPHIPVLILDLSPDAVQALREKIIRIDRQAYDKFRTSEQMADSVLSALGALPATKRNHARG